MGQMRKQDFIGLKSAGKARHCQHLEWEGCPEVDAVCKGCGKDEHEVNAEQDKISKEVFGE